MNQAIICSISKSESKSQLY